MNLFDTELKQNIVCCHLQSCPSPASSKTTLYFLRSPPCRGSSTSHFLDKVEIEPLPRKLAFVPCHGCFFLDINPCLKQEIDSQKLVVFTWLFPRTHTKNNLSCSVFPVKTKRLSFKTSVYPKNLETYNHLSQWNLSGHDVKIIHDFIVI